MPEITTLPQLIEALQFADPGPVLDAGMASLVFGERRHLNLDMWFSFDRASLRPLPPFTVDHEAIVDAIKSRWPVSSWTLHSSGDCTFILGALGSHYWKIDTHARTPTLALCLAAAHVIADKAQDHLAMSARHVEP